MLRGCDTSTVQAMCTHVRMPRGGCRCVGTVNVKRGKTFRVVRYVQRHGMRIRDCSVGGLDRPAGQQA